MMKVLIVGGGKVGSFLASLLTNEGHQVSVIENRAEQLPGLKRDLPSSTIILGSGTDPRILEAANIQDANVIAVVTGDDEINLVAATLAKMEYGVPRVVARVNNPKNVWLYTPEMGVDVALNQAELMASLVAEEMSLGDMMTLLKLHRGKYSLVEEKVHPSSAAVGKSLRELCLPVECVLVAVIRDSELMIPRGHTVLMANDEVLAITHVSQLKTLASVLGAQA
ncbi:MAG: potassium channel family protein [Christensenellales bacterium]